MCWNNLLSMDEERKRFYSLYEHWIQRSRSSITHTVSKKHTILPCPTKNVEQNKIVSPDFFWRDITEVINLLASKILTIFA